MQLTERDLAHRAKAIKLLLLDVDGVMTDGKIYFTNDGQEMKSFNTLDGQGIKSLRRSGVEVGIITGRTSLLVEKRATDLGIHLLIQGREDKYTAMLEMLESYPCDHEAIAFLGDDYPDLTVMTRVGLSLAVANAHPEVASRAHWQSTRRGGEGAVREAIDMLMKHQDSYQSTLQAYIGE